MIDDMIQNLLDLPDQIDHLANVRREIKRLYAEEKSLSNKINSTLMAQINPANQELAKKAIAIALNATQPGEVFEGHDLTMLALMTYETLERDSLATEDSRSKGD